MLDDIRELVEYPLQHPEVKELPPLGRSHGFLKDAMGASCGHAAPQALMIGCMQMWTTVFYAIRVDRVWVAGRCMHGWAWIRPGAFCCMGPQAAARPPLPMPLQMNAMSHSCASQPRRLLRGFQVAS